MELIDIGANLTGSAFNRDLPEVIARASDAGVSHMIVTGTDIQHSRDAIALCEAHPAILTSTAGVHPHHADEFDNGCLEQLEEMLQQECVVAVGECGLDYNRNFSQKQNQLRTFEQQLELAVASQKPVFLHQRDAHDDFLAIMREAMSDISGGVAHCFTGSPAQAEAYLDIGLHIGVTGWICDERRGHDLQQAVSVIPLERILLETDAPYLLPRDLPDGVTTEIAGCPGYQPADKRRNEPCFLQHICLAVASLMDVSAEQLATASTDNVRRLFLSG